jgi:uncharacterized protein YdeI (YjbR/CyaY-like superfamily)
VKARPARGPSAKPAQRAAVAPPRFFATAAAFHTWLAKFHSTATHLLVGFHKVTSGRGGLTYPQALDEALCYGWIDGIRRRIDDDSYSIRFTPRKPNSIWSQINLNHIARLEREGRMTAAGRGIHAARDPKKTFIYSFEVRRFDLSAEFAKRLAADSKAQAHFLASPPGYQRHVTYWIMSAKQDATRERRFEKLLEYSRQGRRIPPLEATKPPAKQARPARPKAAATKRAKPKRKA